MYFRDRSIFDRSRPIPYHDTHKKLGMGRSELTICIAAICGDSSGFDGLPCILAAADRTRTSGDIEFTIPQPKGHVLTPYVGVLTAGNIEFHTLAIDAIRRDDGIQNAPNVAVIATMYAQHLAKQVNRVVEAHVLGHLDLSFDAFIERQNTMQPSIVQGLHADIQQVSQQIRCEGTIFGIDATGPHLYLVDSLGAVVSRDAAAFAAIGTGQRHAESQFMFAQHFRGSSAVDTLFLMYRAKKFAEAAPGVGPDTDLFMVRGDFPFGSLSQEVQLAVDAAYDNYLRQMHAAEQEARRVNQELLRQIGAQATAVTEQSNETASTETT